METNGDRVQINGDKILSIMRRMDFEIHTSYLYRYESKF